MDNQKVQKYKPVRVLPVEVARKIAAGEVIDRPNAVVRELLDNALDSNATSITLDIAGGGIEKVSVIDDGCGMTKDDLENSIKAHATSKIEQEQDLLSLSTMGFRGEALASIAAVSRLEIKTKRDEENAWKLESQVGMKETIEPTVLEKGTVVTSLSLFENFPARRVFLKRPASEGTLCKQTFVEKALPFPQISFRMIMDGKIRLDLPQTENHVERVIQALELQEDKKQFHIIKNSDAVNHNWSFTLVIGDSSVIRSDRKNIHIFVNNRKITEYSLIQAIEYGVMGSFPNGTHPVACLFLEINPSLVDFNIHPAKKEARFKDLSQIHHSISSTTRNVFTQENISLMKNPSSYQSRMDFTEPKFAIAQKEENYGGSGAGSSCAGSSSAGGIPFGKFDDVAGTSMGAPSFGGTHLSSTTGTIGATDFSREGYYTRAGVGSFGAAETSGEDNFGAAGSTTETTGFGAYGITSFPKSTTLPKQYDFKYLGSALNLFLFAEKDESVYVIDQHAGHERVLYEELLRDAGQTQPLLFPFEIEIETESQNEYLESIKEQMDKSGFHLEKTDGKWSITTVPIKWQGTKKDIIDAIFEKQIEPAEFMRHFLATCACKSAIKEGHYIDDQTACDLIEKIFALPDPHCPHGRPIWFILTKEEMYQRVKRT
ncbi:MAG: DNA mismatch repair endonuclease MutL [Treponemataceae bacterium]|nr:DNA mismatch repair endonuclease MutL [Treponemataceae bacterium]